MAADLTQARTNGPGGGMSAHRIQGPAGALARAIRLEPDPDLRRGLEDAARRLGEGDYPGALSLASAAAAKAPRSGPAHSLTGLANEGLGDWAGALEAYQTAHALDPGSSAVLGDLGRLAMTLDLPEAAAAFFSRALAAEAGRDTSAASGLALEPSPETGWARTGSIDLIDQLCQALLGSGRSEEALTWLRLALDARPDNLLLSASLSAALLQNGSTLEALAIAEAILALPPRRAEALYARARARFELGDFAGAESDCSTLLTEEPEGGSAVTRFLRAQTRLASGDLTGGWIDYEARLEPSFTGAPHFDLPLPRWRPDEDLSGLRLLVVGEQGVGDEIMFASMAPDLLQLTRAGPAPALAASPRLAALFARSFPALSLLELRTAAAPGRPRRVEAPGAEAFDVYTPIGSLAARLRPSPEAFARPGTLRPDPLRVHHWRRHLAALGPELKVGVSWKSAKMGGHRGKLYPPLETWRPVFQVPGVIFVVLQYGEISHDLSEARRLGVELWPPPGLDLTQDLDDAAALSAALDLVLGVANASTALAAAVATPTWFILPRAAWPTLGQGRHPWFANTRLFQTAGFDRWPETFTAAAAALRERAGGG